MVSRKVIFAVALASTLLAGCSVDPQSFETAPVSVQTPKGVVVCQLYTRERVLWDRAIDRPDTMTVREADNICRAEGTRWKNSA